VTNSSGVATLTTTTATSDAVGTDTGGVVASFAGDDTYSAANATGNLVVSQAATSLGSAAGTASFGGTATLTATLTSSVTNAGSRAKTVSFTLDGTSVGTAVTNSSGVATLTGVATSDGLGTDTGGVVASFAGGTNYLAAPTPPATWLSVRRPPASRASRARQSGGSATLTATLTSSVTNAGISGETVSFTLDGTSAGTAVTGSNGVATLTGVATSDSVGTITNDVVANFAGDTDYLQSQGTGDLTVTS